MPDIVNSWVEKTKDPHCPKCGQRNIHVGWFIFYSIAIFALGRLLGIHQAMNVMGV